MMTGCLKYVLLCAWAIASSLTLHDFTDFLPTLPSEVVISVYLLRVHVRVCTHVLYTLVMSFPVECCGLGKRHEYT